MKKKSHGISLQKKEKIQSIWRDIFNKLDFAYQIQGIQLYQVFILKMRIIQNILILFVEKC